MRRLTRAPAEAPFGSEMAERLGLAAEDVAAIVGAIVGGAAAAFVIGRFEAGKSLPLMLLQEDSIDPTIEQLLSTGAICIVLAVLSGSASSKPGTQEGGECGGVRFELLDALPNRHVDRTSARAKKATSRL